MSGHLAATLPYGPLVDIFHYAIDVPNDIRAHGGFLASWDSNESMKQLALVCKGWLPAAMAVLYRSVALTFPEAGEAFLRSLAHTPSHAGKVRFLVLSLGEEAITGFDTPKTALQYFRASLDLVYILQAASSNLTHLQLYPLHAAAREPLFKAIAAATSLRVLVCSPRFYEPDAKLMGEEGTWGVDLYSRTDLYDLALPPELHTLELDYESSWSARDLPIHNGLHVSRLRKLRLRCDTDQEVLWEVLGKCTELEVCELYFERLLSRDETTAALRASTASMKHLSFMSNPTLDDLALFDQTQQPIFDRLLPMYTQLETLSVSATEVSAEVFRLIPPSLKSLEVQAFNHVSMFRFTPQMVQDLATPVFAKGLKSVRVHDAAEAWEELDIAQLKTACETRGIEFWFHADSETGL
ncbi:hypothetical protein JCM10213_007794 [Rhodosporidiobolus nylandii]